MSQLSRLFAWFGRALGKAGENQAKVKRDLQEGLELLDLAAEYIPAKYLPALKTFRKRVEWLIRAIEVAELTGG